MQIRLSRREWASLVAAAVPVATSAQTHAIPPAPGNEKLEKAADDIRSNSKRLAAIDLPRDVEPAFLFKP